MKNTRHRIKEGEVFKRLTVISRHQRTPLRWLCKCICGTEKIVSSNCLLEGITRSCGCLRRESSASRFTTHGKSNLPEFNVWCMMRGRCSDTKNQDYPRYGGRGISVSPLWINNFTKFLEDMGPRPTPKHSIERINNDKNYEPENCCWATKTEQANNRVNNVRFLFNGEELTIRELLKYAHKSISFGTLRARIQIYGWSIQRAVSTSVK